MINVLHVRASSNLLGAEKVVLELCHDRARAFGYTPHLAIIHDKRDPIPELATEASKYGIKHKVFTAKSMIDIKCIKILKAYINSNEIDIVHSHGYREDIYCLLATIHQKTIRTTTNHLWKKGSLKLRVYAFIDSVAMIFYKKIIGVSEPIVSEMRSIPHLNSNKIELISNGVDCSAFPIKHNSHHRHADTIIRLITISSLTKEKGHIFLIDALRILADKNIPFKLNIIGDGPLRNEIQDKIIDRELTDRVTLHGKKNNIKELLHNSDIFILPSTIEGLPISLLEAMSTGTACIATDVGDVRKCIDNNFDGLLIPPRNAPELAKAIIRLALDDNLLSQLGSNAAQTIRQRYSNEQMISSYARIYKQLHKFS